MNIKEGDHVKITLEGVVKKTGEGIIGRRYWIFLTNGGLLECDSLEDISIEIVKPPLPTAVGTVLNKAGSFHPYLLKIAENEWVTIHGVRLNNREVQADWDDDLYEVFEVKEDSK